MFAAAGIQDAGGRLILREVAKHLYGCRVVALQAFAYFTLIGICAPFRIYAAGDIPVASFYYMDVFVGFIAAAVQFAHYFVVQE